VYQFAVINDNLTVFLFLERYFWIKTILWPWRLHWH